MGRPKWVQVVAAAALVATLTGCTNDEPSGPRETASTLPAELSVHDTSLPIQTGRLVLHLTTWGHYVAWASGPDADQVDELDVYDLDTGEVQVLPHGPGLTDWVRGDGEAAVFTVQAHAYNETKPTSPWTIIAIDLESGTTRELAASTGGASEELVPLPDIDAGVAAWIEATPEGDAVVTYDLATSERRVVHRGSQLGYLTVSEGLVVFDAPDGGTQRQAFTVPVEGGAAPRAVTTSGAVSYPVAANGRLTWQEPQTGDPRSIWRLELPSGRPSKVVDGVNSGNAVAGTSFVAWLRRDTTLAVTSDAGREQTISEVPISVFARFDADGDRLVWATVDFDPAGRPTTEIHVTQIGAPRRTQ